jgi:hypothetical protein
MSNIFIAALLFLATNSTTPIYATTFETEKECLQAVDDVIELYVAEPEELINHLELAGADDLLIGCFTAEEALTILAD